MTKSISETLYAAADLLEGEGRWTQGEIRRDKDGRYVQSNSDTAFCWCLTGATLKVSSFSDSMEADRYFARFIGVDGVGAVEEWNDDERRTQSEVVAKLREAGDRARSEGK